MSDQNNPYSAPDDSGTAQESDGSGAPDYRTVIRCRGYHHPNDCWMSFAPTNFVASLRKTAFNSLTAVGFGTVLMIMLLLQNRLGERIHPFWFFVFATLATPAWWWVMSWIREWNIATELAQRRHYQEEGPFEGRLDLQGITMITESVYSRASWSFFESVNLQPDRIELSIPATIHRWILPARFFASADEYHDAQRLIADQLNVVQLCPKKSDVLNQPYEVSDSPSFPQIEEGHLWTLQSWPFDPGQETVEFSHRLSLRTLTFAQSCRFAVSLIRNLLFTALPLILSIPIWLLSDYLHFGSWAFLTETPIANLTYLAPTLTLLLLGGWWLYRGYRAATQNLKDERTAVSETGCAFVQRQNAFWKRWDMKMQVINSETQVGLRTDDDELVWNRSLLDSDVATRLEQVLQRVAEKSQSENHDDS